MGAMLKKHFSLLINANDEASRREAVLSSSVARDQASKLNDVECSVIESVRGDDPQYVFTYRVKPVTRMLNSAWLRARLKARLSVRVQRSKAYLWS
jgi:hypothetical protein